MRKYILAVLLCLAAALAPARAQTSVSTNKSFVVGTSGAINNVLPPNETNFFAVNSNLMNLAVGPFAVTNVPGNTNQLFIVGIPGGGVMVSNVWNTNAVGGGSGGNSNYVVAGTGVANAQITGATGTTNTISTVWPTIINGESANPITFNTSLTVRGGLILGANGKITQFASGPTSSNYYNGGLWFDDGSGNLTVHSLVQTYPVSNSFNSALWRDDGAGHLTLKSITQNENTANSFNNNAWGDNGSGNVFVNNMAANGALTVSGASSLDGTKVTTDGTGNITATSITAGLNGVFGSVSGSIAASISGNGGNISNSLGGFVSNSVTMLGTNLSLTSIGNSVTLTLQGLGAGGISETIGCTPAGLTLANSTGLLSASAWTIGPPLTVQNNATLISNVYAASLTVTNGITNAGFTVDGSGNVTLPANLTLTNALNTNGVVASIDTNTGALLLNPASSNTATLEWNGAASGNLSGGSNLPVSGIAPTGTVGQWMNLNSNGWQAASIPSLFLTNLVGQFTSGSYTWSTAYAFASNFFTLSYYSLNGSNSTIGYSNIVAGTSVVIYSGNPNDTNKFSAAIARGNAAAPTPGFGVNFDAVIIPGLVTSTYGSAVSSNNVFSATSQAGSGWPVWTLNGPGQIASGGAFTNIFLKNSNCPSTFPYPNPAVGGVAMVWPGSNVFEWGGTNSGNIEQNFGLASAGPSSISRAVIYTIVTYNGPAQYKRYDTILLNGTNAYYCSENWKDQVGPTMTIEQTLGGIGGNLALNFSHTNLFIMDAPSGGTGTLYGYDLGTGASLGSITCNLNVGTGGSTPSYWTYLEVMSQNVHNLNVQTLTWDYAFIGVTTNKAPVLPTFP